MGSVTLLRLVVPQAEATFDWRILAGTAVFSSARREVSPSESFSGPYVSVSDVPGGTNIREVGVNA
jgi:hypothetical protein